MSSFNHSIYILYCIGQFYCTGSKSLSRTFIYLWFCWAQLRRDRHCSLLRRDRHVNLWVVNPDHFQQVYALSHSAAALSTVPTDPNISPPYNIIYSKSGNDLILLNFTACLQQKLLHPRDPPPFNDFHLILPIE